jgi:hypothetical protein
MNMAPCRECPCPAQGVVCLATVEPSRFAWLCRLARSGDAIERSHVLGRSRLPADLVPDPEPSPQEDRPPAGEIIRNIAKMKQCPHWEASSSCGCGVNICKAGRGKNPGQVSHLECFECLEESRPEIPK